MNTIAKIKQFGDFQTPPYFAKAVCAKLKEKYALAPSVILEPTFGLGSFIDAALEEFETVQRVFGVELNQDYYTYVKERFANHNCSITLYNENIFAFDLHRVQNSLNDSDSVLVIGNPPWITNSQLSLFNSKNIPKKENFKNNSGLDAITGKGNFDIAEYIILSLLSTFSDSNCTVAMLCKTIVAKNILHDIAKYNFTISSADLFLFQATDVFDVSCDAGLFVVRLGKEKTEHCSVYDFDTNNFIRRFGWYNGAFYSDIATCKTIAHIDGKCQLEWRQGIKHDCAKVMEFMPHSENGFVNGYGEFVPLSVGEYIFPLLKSSDIKKSEIVTTRKFVVVPQRQVNADTSVIKYKDSVLWDYLCQHENKLDNRRSIIYKKSPKFSIFGVGVYSFSKHKVVVSGFYKEPLFAYAHAQHPIMLDDTCYFLSFDNSCDAIITTALLNSPTCHNFLKSIAFLDSKRPYTKDVLRRIDLVALADAVGYEFVKNFAFNMQGQYRLSIDQFFAYKKLLI